MKLFASIVALLAVATCIAGHIYDARGSNLAHIFLEKTRDESSTAMPRSSGDLILRLRRTICVSETDLDYSTPSCRSWCKKHPQSIDCLAVICDCEKLALIGDDH